MRWKLGVLAAVMFVATAGVAVGQERHRTPSPYFECPYVNYFGSDCPQLRNPAAHQDGRRPDDGEAPAAPQGTSEPGETPETEDRERRDLDAEDIYPLFPRESLAPDAPPLLRRLLAEPTLANARRYVRWYARRTQRLQEVQALIELAGREGR